MHQTVHVLADRRARIDPFRERIEAAIERLIAVLDSLDDDPDLEPTMAGACSELDECEPEADFEEEPDLEEGGDDEPSLGWGNVMLGVTRRGGEFHAEQDEPGVDQTRLSIYDTKDLEDDIAVDFDRLNRTMKSRAAAL